MKEEAGPRRKRVSLGESERRRKRDGGDGRRGRDGKAELEHTLKRARGSKASGERGYLSGQSKLIVSPHG